MNFIVMFADKNIRVKGTKENPLFSAKDICQVLGITKYRDCITKLSDNQRERIHLDTPGGKQLCSFVTESGVYKLIMRSNKPDAVKFQDYICDDILPCIRKFGCYPAPQTYKSDNKTIKLITENDLHKQVVKFIRCHLGDDFNMIVPLGELQDSSEKRIEAYQKGYKKGVPDIVITSPNGEYNGFCIELKTPSGTGSLSESQCESIERFKNDGFKTLVSNDYDEIVCALMGYKFTLDKMVSTAEQQLKTAKKYLCPWCNKHYANTNYFKKHLEKH